MQVVAAVAGAISGMAETVIEEMLAKPSKSDRWPEEVRPLVAQVRDGLAVLNEAVAFVKSQPGTAYRNLVARKIVDMAIYLLIGALFCDHATAKEEKLAVARYWLAWRMPELRMLAEQVRSGEDAILRNFEALAGPLPAAE